MADHLDKIDIEDLPEDCREIADIIGLDGLLALSEKLGGGERVYIPLPDRLAICARNRAIRDAFNGVNYRELALKYNLTERWIRAIVAGCDPEETGVESKNLYKQCPLF